MIRSDSSLIEKKRIGKGASMFAGTISKHMDKLTFTDKRIANILMSEKEIVKLTSEKVAEKAEGG